MEYFHVHSSVLFRTCVVLAPFRFDMFTIVETLIGSVSFILSRAELICGVLRDTVFVQLMFGEIFTRNPV